MESSPVDLDPETRLGLIDLARAADHLSETLKYLWRDPVVATSLSAYSQRQQEALALWSAVRLDRVCHVARERREDLIVTPGKVLGMSLENRFRYEAAIHLASTVIPFAERDREWLRSAPGNGTGWNETIGISHPWVMERWRAWLWDEEPGSIHPQNKSDYGDASLLRLAAQRIATRLKPYVPRPGA